MIYVSGLLYFFIRDSFFFFFLCFVFFCQAEDGIRDLVRSRGLGDVYKRQVEPRSVAAGAHSRSPAKNASASRSSSSSCSMGLSNARNDITQPCLLYTSDAADERSSVDLGGRRIIKKKKTSTNKSYSLYTRKHV